MELCQGTPPHAIVLAQKTPPPPHKQAAYKHSFSGSKVGVHLVQGAICQRVITVMQNTHQGVQSEKQTEFMCHAYSITLIIPNQDGTILSLFPCRASTWRQCLCRSTSITSSWCRSPAPAPLFSCSSLSCSPTVSSGQYPLSMLTPPCCARARKFHENSGCRHQFDGFGFEWMLTKSRDSDEHGKLFAFRFLMLLETIATVASC